MKPSNIGITETLETKILDFGLARSDGVDPNNLNDMNLPDMTRLVVTCSYRAPEIMLSSHYDGHAVDMWSLGCILGEMCLGEMMFKAVSDLELCKKLVYELGPPPPELLTRCSENVGISFGKHGILCFTVSPMMYWAMLSGQVISGEGSKEAARS